MKQQRFVWIFANFTKEQFHVRNFNLSWNLLWCPIDFNKLVYIPESSLLDHIAHLPPHIALPPAKCSYCLSATIPCQMWLLLKSHDPPPPAKCGYILFIKYMHHRCTYVYTWKLSSCPHSSSPSPHCTICWAPRSLRRLSQVWANVQKFGYALEPRPNTAYLECQYRKL